MDACQVLGQNNLTGLQSALVAIEGTTPFCFCCSLLKLRLHLHLGRSQGDNTFISVLSPHIFVCRSHMPSIRAGVPMDKFILVLIQVPSRQLHIDLGSPACIVLGISAVAGSAS
jgi:hypothetical protein